jgi:hypothetical protein
MSDELKPEYMFQTFKTALLVKIANGEVDPMVLVGQELAKRGVNEKGEWVGFEAAQKIWAPQLAPVCGYCGGLISLPAQSTSCFADHDNGNQVLCGMCGADFSVEGASEDEDYMCGDCAGIMAAEAAAQFEREYKGSKQ